MSPDEQDQSIANRLLSHWQRSELAYTTNEDGQAFWPPRAYAPHTGTPTQWRISKGHGTVYARTTQYPRNAEPRHLALIELDEGFRMLSRLADASAAIGERVLVKFVDGDTPEPVRYPVFALAKAVAL